MHIKGSYNQIRMDHITYTKNFLTEYTSLRSFKYHLYLGLGMHSVSDIIIVKIISSFPVNVMHV